MSTKEFDCQYCNGRHTAANACVRYRHAVANNECDNCHERHGQHLVGCPIGRLSPTGDTTAASWDALLREFGDASFDYATMENDLAAYRRVEAARINLIDAHRKLVEALETAQYALSSYRRYESAMALKGQGHYDSDPRFLHAEEAVDIVLAAAEAQQ